MDDIAGKKAQATFSWVYKTCRDTEVARIASGLPLIEYVGLGVSLETTAVCVIDDKGATALVRNTRARAREQRAKLMN